jgi:hypothetical protein
VHEAQRPPVLLAGLLEWLMCSCKRYRVDKLLIESKASGISAAQELRKRPTLSRFRYQRIAVWRSTTRKSSTRTTARHASPTAAVQSLPLLMDEPLCRRRDPAQRSATRH